MIAQIPGNRLLHCLWALLFAASTALAEDGPFLSTTEHLPPVAPAGPAEDRTDLCGEDGLRCIRWVEKQLAAWESYFGCDHRAVFPTVYRLLTRETRLYLERDPGLFEDPAGLGYEAVKFYELYDQMIKAHLAGKPIPSAWQTAMEAARDGDWTGGHDMLLAINAHVQRDMPFALAAAGINLPSGESRKGDHDRFNEILNAAYDTIVQEIGRRYDPALSDVDDQGGPFDNLGAQQLVAAWREGVFRNAERITMAEGNPAMMSITRESIESFANVSAQIIRNGELPGQRARRLAHCQTALAGELKNQPGSPPRGDDRFDTKHK